MSLQRNYYEVLGIPPGATTDQIKKKYRELARKFHPDVVQDKVLGQRVFSQINQAYRVLADPDRRAQYNTQLAAASGANTQNSQAAPAPAQPSVQSQARPGQPGAQARPGQTATTAQPVNHQTLRPHSPNAQTGSPAQARPVAPPGQPGSAQKAQAVAARLADAENAIMAGRPIDANAMCMIVLGIDPSNARALEISGDALELMGKREDAAVQYRKALKIAPSSLIQSKLSRLEQAAAPTRTNPPQRTIPPEADKGGDKGGGGLFGRFLGKK